MSLYALSQAFICLLGVGLIGALIQLFVPSDLLLPRDSSDHFIDREDNSDESNDVQRYSTTEDTERYILDQATDSQNQANHDHHHLNDK